jgi:serine/threonine protein kinase
VPLTPGARLGPYEILSCLGAGGMGEVYRARDTRLDRFVAIKVLHEREHHASRPDLRVRLEREARVLSQLSHPHICTLHDIGEYEGSTYLVLELLTGETLADRLAQLKPHPLPVRQAVAIAIDVAEALDAAHNRGVVHRDLKPSNIMLTATGAKLLDFGISKAVTASAASETLTAEGTLLGTVQYMAPEQLEGREADARTDIFAFGAVVYEMVTGRIAFPGATQAAVIAAILDSEPPPIASVGHLAGSSSSDATSTDQQVLPLLETALRRCLAKHPDERWHPTAALIGDLRRITEDSSGKAYQKGRDALDRRRLTWLLSAVTATLVVGAAVLLAPAIRRAVSRPPTSLEIRTPPTRDLTSLAISPDGGELVFTGDSEGIGRLWLRQLDQPTSRPLSGTEGGYAPFWSPDGSEIGFFSGGKLRRIDVASGYVQVIADAPSGRGGTWNTDGVIVFAPIATAGLMRVPASGGTPTSVVDGGPGRGTPRWPQFLPDGHRFLFYLPSVARPEIRGAYVGSLDGTPPKRIMDAFGSATFVPPHWLFFELYGSLRAQRFDPERTVVDGNPTLVAPEVAYDGSVLRDAFAGSANGVLAYRTSDRRYRSDLVWRDRHGRLLGALGSLEGLPPAPALSLDGQRVALARRVEGSDNIWIFEAKGGTPTRLTSDPPGSNARVISERNPIWSPDGGRVVFASARKGGSSATDLYVRAIVGGDDRLLLETPDIKYAQSWSRDGRFLLYSTLSAQTGLDIWALPLNRDQKPFAVAQSSAAEDLGQFSPDSRWVAYQSNASGRFEIYVQSFPAPSIQTKVSVAGGVQPRWSHDGRELFYVAPDGQMMSAPIDMRDPGILTAGPPAALFSARLVEDGNSIGREIPQYDVGPDGRFLLVSPPEEKAPPPLIRVILNWNGSPIR